MKNFIIFCFLFFAINTISAQTLVFHAGGGWASHYGKSSKNIGAFKIGASLEFELNQRLTFEPGFLYVSKGWKDHDQTVLVYDDNGNIVYDNNGVPRMAQMNITNKTNYLVLPILVNYYIPLTIPHYVYFSIGPYFAYGIGGKARVSGDTSQQGAARFYYDHNIFDQENMHRFDAGITLGFGYEFNKNINAGLEGNFGLTNVNTSKRKNISFMLTLGYRIQL